MKLFDSEKPFYKGNLHLHTTNSDGRKSPGQVIELYRQKGYHFLAVTDHWKYGYEGYDGGMLLLPAAELDFTLPTQVIHIVCLGIQSNLFDRVNRQTPVQQAIDAVFAGGGRAILAHPAWSLNTPDVIASLRNIAATEIYNTVSGSPWNADRADSSAIVDIAASNGTLLNLVAADDAHFYDGDACQSFIQVQAEALTQQAIFEALDAGRFYASCGPEFYQIEREGDRIIIECSPANQIMFYSNLQWVADRCRTGSGMTRCEYAIDAKRGERYVRCRITDDKGRSAWCNPIRV